MAGCLGGLYLYTTAIFIKLEGTLESSTGLVKTLIVDSTPRISDSGSRSGQEICISNKFPVMLMLLIWGLHFENHCCRDTQLFLTGGLGHCSTDYHKVLRV